MNEAAILAARRGNKSIQMEELEESIDRVIAGPERKSKKISPREKEITAYHEAGHALVAKILPNADPPRKITIIPRGMALGYTKPLHEDRYVWSRAQFNDELAVLMAGRTAEELTFSEITTGAQDDIKRATKVARGMVTDLGMSDKLGPRTFGDKQELVFLGREISEHKDYSERYALEIDKEIKRIIEEARSTARKILTENKAKLVQIAERLIAKETLEAEELESIFNEAVPSPEPEAVEQPATEPVTARPKSKSRQPKKSPALPHLLPKQTPATLD
jgi:cell division protease FtsH